MSAALAPHLHSLILRDRSRGVSSCLRFNHACLPDLVWVFFFLSVFLFSGLEKLAARPQFVSSRLPLSAKWERVENKEHRNTVLNISETIRKVVQTIHKETKKTRVIFPPLLPQRQGFTGYSGVMEPLHRSPVKGS